MKKRKKITDKERLDWLQLEAKSTNCPRGWHGAIFQTGIDCELVSLRDAVDSAMNSQRKTGGRE